MTQVDVNPFVLLWDRLRQGNPFQALAEFPFSSLEVRQRSPWKSLYVEHPMTGKYHLVNPAGW